MIQRHLLWQIQSQLLVHATVVVHRLSVLELNFAPLAVSSKVKGKLTLELRVSYCNEDVRFDADA
jgi:hypothetical protein